MALTRHRRHKRKGQKKTMMGGRKRSTRGKGCKMGRRSRRMRGGAVLTEIAQRGHLVPPNYFQAADCLVQGFTCPPTSNLTNEQRMALENYIKVSNSVLKQKVYSKESYAPLAAAEQQLTLAFPNGTRTENLAKLLDQSDLKNFYLAKNVGECFTNISRYNNDYCLKQDSSDQNEFL